MSCQCHESQFLNQYHLHSETITFKESIKRDLTLCFLPFLREFLFDYVNGMFRSKLKYLRSLYERLT